MFRIDHQGHLSRFDVAVCRSRLLVKQTKPRRASLFRDSWKNAYYCEGLYASGRIAAYAIESSVTFSYEGKFTCGQNSCRLRSEGWRSVAEEGLKRAKTDFGGVSEGPRIASTTCLPLLTRSQNFCTPLRKDRSDPTPWHPRQRRRNRM